VAFQIAGPRYECASGSRAAILCALRASGEKIHGEKENKWLVIVLLVGTSLSAARLSMPLIFIAFYLSCEERPLHIKARYKSE
jgi:hypothetical protein